MRHAILFALILMAPASAIADDIPDEKRKAIVEAIKERLAKAAKAQEDAEAKVKLLASAKIDPNLKAQSRIPLDPAMPPVFKSKKARDEYVAELAKVAAKAKGDVESFAGNPASFGPSIGSFEKGNFGVIGNPNTIVTKVVDEQQAVITITAFNPRTGDPSRSRFLLAGIDTSNLADGKPIVLKDIYYVTGNAMVGGATLMRLVPVTLTTEERKQLGLPVEKK